MARRDQADRGGALVDAVVQLSFAVHEVLGRLAAEHDLSLTQVRLLGVLRDREPAMLELARLLHLEKSSASGLVDRAERRGLVVRLRGVGTDARAVHVRLAPAGHELARTFAAALEERLPVLLEPLGAREREALARLAGRVVAP